MAVSPADRTTGFPPVDYRYCPRHHADPGESPSFGHESLGPGAVPTPCGCDKEIFNIFLKNCNMFRSVEYSSIVMNTPKGYLPKLAVVLPRPARTFHAVWTGPKGAGKI